MMGGMILPDWRTFSGGGTKRAALWLLAEVGEGNTFTKGRLRTAFPGESQIDRRVRDLRDEGWVIHTNREDVSLNQEEQRLVTVGGRVWEKGYRSRKERTLTAKERQAVFARDHYACFVCGISGGEQYADDPLVRAKLTVAGVSGAGGDTKFATMCERCHKGLADPPQLDDLRERAAKLDAKQYERLVDWMKKGRRTSDPEERVWIDFRRMPSESRDEFRDWLIARES